MTRTVFVAGLAVFGQLVAGDCVVESARRIPLAADSDVLVLGGSSGAVAAAVAAKEAGARVFLLAPRPYLGEDVAGTLRLALEPGEHPVGDLAEKIWIDREACVPFTYTFDQPVNKAHRDTGGLLSDGNASDPVRGSVQFDAPKVKTSITLSETRHIDAVELWTFVRRDDFGVSSARLVTSVDGKKWTRPIQMKRCEDGTQEVWHWRAELGFPVRHIGLAAFRRDGCSRMLLGEIACRTSVPSGGRLRVPTPLGVKQALDAALLTNGIPFLTGSYVTDVLRDGKGEVSGVVVANRSGRQAFTAKTVIDATTRATAARLAGVPFDPYPVGDAEFTRIVISGTKPKAEGMTVRELPGDYTSSVQWKRSRGRDVTVAGRAWECKFRVPMRDGSYRSFAEAEQRARDLTFTLEQLDTADENFQVPPDRATGSVGHVFVLGGCAALESGQDPAARLRPLALMAWGADVGRRAAADAAAREKVGGVSVGAPAAAEGAADRGEVCEFLQGLRPFEKSERTVPSPARTLPVLGSWDVVVAGGGTGGAPAGIGAGRRGAKTLLLEYLYGLGGLGTLGMIGKYWYGNVCGFTAEHDRDVAALGATVRGVGKRECWRRENRDAGTELWFGAMACGTLVKDGRVVGVVVATPEGRGVVLAGNVVDATGNSDLAAQSGAPCVYLDDGELALQGAGLPLRKLGATYINSDWGYVNDGDAVDQWLFALRGRSGGGRSWDVSQVTGSRERRRVVGAVTVMPLDVVNERTFPDTVVQGRSDFDSHGPSVDDICYVSPATGKKIYGVNVPYRALLPKELDGLAVVGLGASAHRDAMPLMRMQPDIQNEGYAAGVAAAMACAAGTDLRHVDVKALQRHLVEIGVIPEEVLTWRDNAANAPEALETAVKTVGDGYVGVAAVLSEPERAKPLLRAAYEKASVPSARLAYAHVLGILGDATGAETLADQVAGKSPAISFNPNGLAAFGRRMPERDSFIVALGRTRSPKALAPLVEEARRLDRRSPSVHVRAVSLALEALADPAAAPALEEALAKPGVGGWAREGGAAATPAGGFGSSAESGRCLRELNLARALWRCGDPNGVARRVFEAYARDGRGVFAHHARIVLTGNPGPAEK